MPCANCRRPRPVRRPSTPSGTPSGTLPRTSRSTTRSAVSGGQRSKITGLTYVPKR